MPRRLAPALLFALAPLAVPAQTSVPPNQVSVKGDASFLKPPAGAKVAIVEFEDLECPACAHAFPIVHVAANHYHVPLEERDFQIPNHIWSHDAAIFSHYLKAKVSPGLAEEYRREVFASQQRIASKDDLRNFNQSFMSRAGKQMPFVVDPTGEYDREVNATTAEGSRFGLQRTPTIFVVTPTHWIEVADVNDMYAAIDQAEAETNRTTASNTHRTTTTATAHK